jgi:hypothetical protein
MPRVFLDEDLAPASDERRIDLRTHHRAATHGRISRIEFVSSTSVAAISATLAGSRETRARNSHR